MPLFRLFGRTGVRDLAAALLACVLATPAARAAFVDVDALRRVAIEAHLRAVDTVTGLAQQADFADERAAPPLSLPLLQVGLALPLADLADAQGRATLDTRFDAASLSFAAIADVNVSGMPAGTLEVSGRAQASADLAIRFVLEQPGTLRLTMDSSVAPWREDDFRFLLAHADGTPVWSDTIVAGPDGNLQRAFTRWLQLDAGAYSLVAALHADARFDANEAVAGRSLADVTLTLVPEPPALLLLGAGLLPLLWRHRRRPACHA